MLQFSGVVSVQYPLVYESFLAALSVVNLNLGDMMSLTCVLETNFYIQLILATTGPMVLLSALAITCLVAVRRNGHSIRAMRLAKNEHLSVALFIIFIVYSSVSYTIFQTFVCDTLDSEVTCLRADYSIMCSTGTHEGYMTYAGLMVFVYPVGIPTAFAWLLFTNRHEIKNVDTTNRAGVQVEPMRLEALEAFKDLLAPYKRNRHYYEVIECVRRIALTGFAVFIYPGSTGQVAIEALFAVLFSTMTEMLSPFADSLDAWLYRFGTWIIFLSMYLALLLKVNAADEESQSQNIFAGLLIAAHVGMICMVIAHAVLSVWKGFVKVRAVEMPTMLTRQLAPQPMSPALHGENNFAAQGEDLKFEEDKNETIPPL